MVAEVITLHKSNFRQPVATLRAIADEIEAGKYGEVGSVGVVVLGETMEVFGAGVDSEAPSVALLLHAGFMRLSKAVEGHGKWRYYTLRTEFCRLYNSHKELAMAKSVLSDKHYQDEAAAYAFVESKLWPNGPVCPHCGGVDRIGNLQGKSTRIGVYKCYQCYKPFSVKVGTVFESSHIPMKLWLQAMYLLASSKKGISSNQLHRTLGVTLKTAWFMSHRLRLAMQTVGIEPLGGLETPVESDETYIGKLDGPEGKVSRGGRHKNVVLTLVERGGEARSFHVASTGRNAIESIVRDNVSKEATLMTDEANHYKRVGKQFIDHQTVNHSEDEYARGIVHTNTVEGYYSIFKRGMKGIYQHCGERHLHRYLAEFDFRYSNRVRLGVNDMARTERMIKGVVGKRLTYQTTN